MAMNAKKTNISLLKEIAINEGYRVTYFKDPATRLPVLNISDGKNFYLASAGKYGFYPDMSRWHSALFTSKISAQTLLRELGYKTIDTLYCNPSHESSAEMFRRASGYFKNFPILIKPNKGMRGQNISTVKNKSELEKRIKEFCKSESDFLIQPFLSGAEFRILVINGKAVAMQQKEFPAISGDGVRTISQLLNEIPDEKIDINSVNRELKKRSLKQEHVLKKDVSLPYHVVGKNTANTNENKMLVSDEIPRAVSFWTKKISKNLGCKTIGIDIFVKDNLNKVDDFIIIELNGNPGFDYFINQFDEQENLTLIWSSVLKNYFQKK